MPIVRKAPPEASREALAPLIGSDAMTPFGVGAGPAGIRQPDLMPHRAFVMTADDCASGVLPADFAQYVGWRYVVRGALEIGVAVVEELRPGNQHRLAEVNKGPFADATPEAFRVIRSRGERQAAELELTFLGIPALYLEAFWLRSASGVEDLFLPFGSVPAGLTSDIYPQEAWVAAVQPLARRVLDLASRF